MTVWAPTIAAAVPGDDTVLIVTWGPMANGDTAIGYPAAQWSDRTIQVAGTFGASGNVAIQASNNGGANYAVLQDDFGTALNITAASIRKAAAPVQLIAPAVTAGDGTTALTVSMIVRRLQQLHYSN